MKNSWIPRSIWTAPVALLFLGCASHLNSIADFDNENFKSSPIFTHPLKSPKITQEFRQKKNGRKKRHWGMDFGGGLNTPIYAAHDGKVIYRGNGFSGFGNLVIIETSDKKWASFYAHLNRFKIKDGHQVKKGELIGMMGRTGRATGVHLHFEVRFNRRPVDPSLVLNSSIQELL